MRTLRHGLLAATATLVLAGAAMAQDRPLRLDESAIGEIDPAKGTDYADTVLAINLYESLVYPKQGGTGVEPWLAKSWTVSDDGLTYSFTLRDTATFSSGNPVTSADVVYSFDRMVALGLGTSSLFEGRVASVAAPDAKTVVFTLKAPFAPFLASLVRLGVVDSQVVKANQGPGKFGDNGDYASDWLSAHSAGSGAYMVTAQDPQSQTVMVPNPHYDGPAADPLAPTEVTYRYSLEPSTVRALMARGEHDISSLWLPPEVLKALVKDKVAHLDLEPGGTGEYIKLNTARAPLDDVHCRLALSYAYDYATTLKLLSITDDVAQGVPMNGALPKGMLGADIDAPDFRQDMTKAKAELAQCKYKPADYPLDIAWIAEVPARERIALLMQASFSQLGFKVNVIRQPWALVSDEVTKPATAPHAIEIAVSGLTPDTDSLAYNMYSSSVPPTWMSAEHLKDAEVDKLLEEGRNETDDAKRDAIYQQLNLRLRALAPDIFAYEFTGVYAVRNGINIPDLEEPGKRYPMASFSMLFKDMQVHD